jgi:sugar phosphate permease
VGTFKQLGYAGGALINGPFIDYSNPAKIFGAALILAGGTNIAIMGATSVQVVAVLWVLNGLFQSVGWPALTRVFLAWFPDPKTRGTAYSFLSTSQNVGAFLVPLFVPVVMSNLGWRGGSRSWDNCHSLWRCAGVLLIWFPFWRSGGWPATQQISKPASN